MVLTEDGFKCKRGETMWAIGITQHMRLYRPFKVKAHSRGADYNHDGLKVWKEYENCRTECESRNKAKTNKSTI